MTKKRTARPWGAYTAITTGNGFKVKLVEVLPGKRLSLQRHKFRSEHWVVVQGIAKITKGDNIVYLKENQSAYIPKKTIHRLENAQKRGKLRIIEVQCGKYTGEDDIERLEDDHGRVTQ